MEFRILGPLEVVGPLGTAPLRGGKQLALLSALLMEPNRIVSAERLIEAIWDQRPPSTASAALQTYVFRLRSALGRADRAAVDRIVTHRSSGYQLHLDPDELDLTRFREYQARGQAAAERGQDSEAAVAFRNGLALWRGPALTGVPGALAQRYAAGLAEEYQNMLEQRIEADLTCGMSSELVAELRRLIDAYPLRDRLYRHLMLALYRCDRRAEALEVFRQARRTLVTELGIEPSQELQDLHRNILDAKSAKPPRTQPAKSVPVPRQIPAGSPTFVGREDYLTALDELTDPGHTEPAVSITTITGGAGVGKTALAVHWAQRARETYPDGQLYVNLRGYGPTAPLDPGDVLAGFLRALGIAPERMPLEEDERAGLYRSLLAERNVLVVLDNAATSDQVRPLLPGSPTCQVLITSRDDLRGLTADYDAKRLVLNPLSSSEAVALLGRTLGAERVRAEHAAAADLAKLCANLPLALRIAAANLADRPGLQLSSATAELASGDRLDQLEVIDDPALAVRGALGHSYTRLDPAAQRVFRLLGLAPGSDFTSEAVAALTDLPRREMTRLLAKLAAAHLIEWHGPSRFQFHDLLRDFARERAEEEEDAEQRRAAVHRLLDWYLHTAFAATQLLNRNDSRIFSLEPLAAPERRIEFSDYKASMAWCESERTNLVAAAECALDYGFNTIAWQLPASLWYFFFLRKYLPDWVHTHEVGLTAAERADDRYGQSWMLNGLAGALREQRRFEDSADCCLRALQFSRAVGDRRGQSANLTNLGWAYLRMGRFTESVQTYRQGLEIKREIGDRWGEAATLTLLAQAHRSADALQDALAVSRQALEIWQETGVRWGTGANLDNIGAVYGKMGRFDQAVEHYRQALAVRRDAGDAWGEAETLANLGRALSSDGQTEEAKRCWSRALALFEEFGHPQAQEARRELDSLTGD